MTSPHILVVDDDPLLRDLYIDILTAEHCHVTTLSHASAWEHLHDATWSMILLDPRGRYHETDWAIVDAIRADARLATIPLVLVTSLDVMGERPELQERIAVLGKPFELDDLLALLSEHNLRTAA